MDAAPCRSGVALRSVRTSCPDSRARHPCLAWRDPAPSVHGLPICGFDPPVAPWLSADRSGYWEWPRAVTGRGLRRAAHGCAAAASQPWMADRAEEQPPARDGLDPQARIHPLEETQARNGATAPAAPRFRRTASTVQARVLQGEGRPLPMPTDRAFRYANQAFHRSRHAHRAAHGPRRTGSRCGDPVHPHQRQWRWHRGGRSHRL